MGRLTTELLGQLAFTTSKRCAIKHGPLSSAVVIPNTRPPSAYPEHYPRRWLLRASFPLRHLAGYLLSQSPSINSGQAESLKQVTPFPSSMGRDLRPLLYAGIRSSGCYVPVDNVAWIHSLLGLPINQRGQVLLDDASTTASLIVDLSHRLDGITTSGSPYSAFSSRFCPLITSRRVGDDAVTRTTSGVGLDDTGVSSHQHRTRVIKEQRCSLPPIPRLEGRFRANGSHQANAADATSSIFCDVVFCTLRLPVIGGFVGAAETEAVI